MRQSPRQAATQVCVLLFRVSEMVAAAVDLLKVSTGWSASLAPISAAPFLSVTDYGCALLFALITEAAVYLFAPCFLCTRWKISGRSKSRQRYNGAFSLYGGFEGCVLPYCLRRSIDKCDLHALSDVEELEGFDYVFGVTVSTEK